MHWQLDTQDHLQISMHEMLWKVGGNIICVVVCKPNVMDGITYIWELDDGLNVHFKSQKRKVQLIMDNFASHSLKHDGRGESLGFSTSHLSNILLLSYHLMLQSVVQRLGQGMIVSFKVGYKISFWNVFPLSLFPNFTGTWVREIVPNVRHAIMWCSPVGREMKLGWRLQDCTCKLECQFCHI